MLRGTNDSCSLLRHTLSQHSHPERRTCHDVSFIPHVWHQAWICHDITLRLCVSYCLLFFISSPLVDLSLDLAVSGFVCVCLSACSSVSPIFIWKGCYCHECTGYQGNERKSSPLQHTFKAILGIHTETHSTLHMLDYSGVETQAKVNSYWKWYILSLQGLPPDPRLILEQRRIKACIKKKGKWKVGRWTSSAMI